MADYMLGAGEAEAVMALLAAYGRPMSDRAPLHARQPPMEEAMRAFLDRLEAEFGGARSYALALGVPDEAIERFVASAIE